MKNLTFLLALSLFCAPLMAAPVAVLSEVKGKVEILRGGTKLGAKTGASLQNGDKIASRGGTATVFYLGRPPQKLAAGAVLGVGAATASQSSLWNSVYAGVSSGLAARNTRVALTVRGGKLRAISPVGGLVLDGRPTLAWDASQMDKTEFPQVLVLLQRLEVGQKKGKTAWAEVVASDFLEFPAHRAELAPGQYEWSVTPRRNSADGSVELARELGVSARFEVATPQKRADFATILSQIAKETRDAPREWQIVARAALMRQHGFLAAAAKEVEKLTPGTRSEAAQGILEAIWAQNGQNWRFPASRLVVAPPKSNADAQVLEFSAPTDAFVPLEARKWFFDAQFSVQIPRRWGVYESAEAPMPPKSRIVEWAMGALTTPRISVVLAPADGASLTEKLLAVSRQNGKVESKKGAGVFQKRPVTRTDWTFSNARMSLEGSSFEWTEGETAWVVNFSAGKRDSAEFRAVEGLAGTLKVGKTAFVAPKTTTGADLMKEMEAALETMTEINAIRDERFQNVASQEAFEELEIKRQAAPMATHERARAARLSARAASKRAWDFLVAEKSAEALVWFERRALLQKEEYDNERGWLEGQMARTQKRIGELETQTLPLGLAFGASLVLDNLLDIQSWRLAALQNLARDNADLARHVYYARGEWEVRRKQLENAVLGGDGDGLWLKQRQALATAVGSLGDATQETGDYEAAKAYFAKALEWRRALPTSFVGREEDNALRDLGSLESDFGDIQTAVKWYEMALAAMDARMPLRREQIAKTDNGELRVLMETETAQGYAVLFNNLGVMSQSLGDYGTAQSYFDKALAKLEPLPTTGFAGRVRAGQQGHTLGNVAVLKSDSGDPEGALKLLETVIAMHQASGDEAGAALGLFNRAGISEERGDWARARRDLAEARALFVLLQMPTRVVSADNFAARLALQAGDLAGAEKFAASAVVFARGQKRPDLVASTARAAARVELARPKPDLGKVRAWLGEASRAADLSGERQSQIMTLGLWAKYHEENEDLEEALKFLKAAITRLEAVRATTVSPEAFGELKENYSLYEGAVRLLLQLKRPDEAFDFLSRARSKRLQDSMRISNLRDADPAVQALLERAGKLEQRLGVMRAQLDTERARPKEERDLKRVENLVGLVAQTQAEFFAVSGQLKEKYPNFEKVVALKPRELKKAQKAIPQDTVLLQYAPLGEELYIFVVTQNDLKIITSPTKSSAVKADVRRFRTLMDEAQKAVQSGQKVGAPEDNAALKAVCTGLYKSLIAPIASELEGKSVVAIVPTQELFYLPFHALAREENGKLRFFIEDKQVAYLAAADVLAVVQTRSEDQFGAGLLALGDPSGAQLPAAREEVAAIARIFPASQFLTGAGAQKSVLLDAKSEGKRVWHLAAHGVLDGKRPERSYIQLSPSAGDDGKLRVGDVYGLDLNKVDLVTLSACQTAIGEGEPDGAEITSLAESFSSAGTPSVVASLWSVEDQSTRQLMESFYRGLADGNSKSAALQAAQIGLLKAPATRHPFFWGAFELLGDWR